MPFAFPENAPVYVSVQPAGMVVQGLTPGVTRGIRVIYPNLSHEAPGSRGWYVYGRGQASADGRQIVPDAPVALHGSVGFMYTATNPIAPPVAPPPPCGAGSCCPQAPGAATRPTCPPACLCMNNNAASFSAPPADTATAN